MVKMSSTVVDGFEDGGAGCESEIRISEIMQLSVVEKPGR